MPQLYTEITRHSEQCFLYLESEPLHPILEAVKNDDLPALKAAIKEGANVEIEEESSAWRYPLSSVRQLLIANELSVHDYQTPKNVPCWAAKLGHHNIVHHLLFYREALGLSNQDFLGAIDVASGAHAKRALKNVFEQFPDVIDAYNQSTSGKVYQPAGMAAVAKQSGTSEEDSYFQLFV
ncbi:MAG: hypothetical protein P1U32_03475 [Legionellaceae bacterium]|nr:hypothetical protein [Legionellaceae bacterium]